MLLFGLFLFGCVAEEPVVSPTATPTFMPTAAPPTSSASMKSFTSWDELSEFIGDQSSRGYYEEGMPMLAAGVKSSADATGAVATQAPDYSTTNVQVAGVDEADIVKTDGKHVFVVTQGKVVILDAYPAESMKILSELELDRGRVSDIFINGGKLVVFGSEEETFHPLETEVRCAFGRCPYYYSSAFVKVYDVSEAASPKLVKTISMKGGNYVESRLIEGKVYALFNEPAYRDYPIPLYTVDGLTRELAPSDVKYFDYPDYNYAFNVFLGLDLNDLSKPEQKEIILMGSSNTVFVSAENIYTAYTRYDYGSQIPWSVYEEIVVPMLPEDVLKKIRAVDSSDLSDWRKERMKIGQATEYLNDLSSAERNKIYEKLQDALKNVKQDQYAEKTVVHKISLDGFKHLAEGEVPGTVLNQFSMDEYNGYFRIATTTGQLIKFGVVDASKPEVSKNHVFILDGNLKTVGRLQDLAPNEKIYSARFMGDRCYLVTFKKVDPLFAIDLSDPTNPRVLGQLKIPGYSDYLHPYDENHLIGLGKGAVAAEEGDFAWYQGVKLSLFDVSDVSKPKETANFEIGDRGTSSYALDDHKAFLFSKDKNLLVIPVLLAEIDESKYPNGVEANTYGDFVFQGAYVFSVDLNGFTLKGRVSHADPETLEKAGDYYYGDSDNVKRSLYIGDVLYTVSDAFVKANALADLSEKASVKIGSVEEPPIYRGIPV